MQFDDNVEKRLNRFGDLGCFALRSFAAGEVLGENVSELAPEQKLTWRVMTLEEASRLTDTERATFFKFGWSVDFEGHVLGPTDAKYAIKKKNYMNHSCDPNLWFGETDDTWVARRDIAAGEELTIDYMVFSVNWDDSFDCQCGSATCRGRVRGDDWRSFLKTYGLHFPYYLRSKISELLQH